MFCPKCGTQNPDHGKFCRSCGTDLSPVSEALSGKSSSKNSGLGLSVSVNPLEGCNKKDKPVTLENAITMIFMGLAFLIVSIILGVTGVANSGKWWFWLLIPAFGMLGSGVAQLVQIKRLEAKTALPPASEPARSFAAAPATSALPPTQTEYISPGAETRYKTGDLVPPSVTEETTRHLELNHEGETMTLPKTKP